MVLTRNTSNFYLSNWVSWTLATGSGRSKRAKKPQVEKFQQIRLRPAPPNPYSNDPKQRTSQARIINKRTFKMRFDSFITALAFVSVQAVKLNDVALPDETVLA